jgi:hypothetical protein
MISGAEGSIGVLELVVQESSLSLLSDSLVDFGGCFWSGAAFDMRLRGCGWTCSRGGLRVKRRV